jgi:hypothetical protein
MKITFIHLSDLHYRKGWPEEVTLVCKKLHEDLSNQLPVYENAYLIFSGDLVFAGGEPELYSNFHSDFVANFEGIGLSRERRICAPGNHDLSREALKPLLMMQRGSLQMMTSEQLFNEQLPQLSNTLFAPKFKNYTKYEQQFASFTCCQNSLGGTGWRLSEEVGVFCLNTALCSLAGLDDVSTNRPYSDHKQLMVGTRSLYEWLTNFSFKTRVLVMHHPVEWLADWAQVELEKIIAQNFQLVFSGHIHSNSAVFTSRQYKAVVSCSAPPLFTKKI